MVEAGSGDGVHPAGWLPDGSGNLRWWDGSQWTEHVQMPSAAPALSVSPVAAPTSNFVVTIGDIGVTSSEIVTPNGTAPLAGASFIFRDMSIQEKKIPTWAIILAIVFAVACLLGLLFLLVKEDVVRGYAEVTVRSGELQHMTQLPISNAQQLAHYRGLVSQAQNMAASAV
jgi:hypothetical protein